MQFNPKALFIPVGLIALGLLYQPGGYVADWLFPDSEWATRWRYGLEDDLEGAVYQFDKQPHDCEFMSAPMGSKHCHYERQVATIRIRTNQSRREVSFDEGRTWFSAEGTERRAVFVTWKNVQE